MGNISKFAAVNTKVKVMRSQLLKDDDYKKIVAMESIEEIIEYLKMETWYGSLMPADENQDIHVIESIFKKNVFEKYEKLFHYFSGEYKKFFRVLFMRYEIENIKVFIRMIVRKESLKNVSEHIIIPKIETKVNYSALYDARSLDDLIVGLEDTEYAKIINLYRNEDEDKLLFYLEMNLDRLYFKKLYSQMKRLDASDQRAVSEVLGRNIDLLNLQWIYRGRRYYKVSAEEIINYSLSGGKYFGYQKLKDLCYKERIEDVETVIKNSEYAALLGDIPNFEIFMERSMEQYLYKYFNKLKKEFTMSIIEPLLYMHHLEYEMRDLYTIVETKRYGLPEEECIKYLVRNLT